MTARFIEDLSLKIMEIYKSSPAEDLKNNSQALLQGIFSKLELVSREEFDVQAHLLRDSRQKLAVSEARLEVLEQNITKLESLLYKRNK
ncbi:MAG: accessory factor UbiK family protein [Methylophilaceae bacterium]